VGHVHRVRPDVLHTHLGYADVLGGLAGRLLGVPVVSTVHGHQWDGDRRERLRVGLQATVRRHAATRVIAVSDAARAAYLSSGADRDEHVVTIRNAVSPTPAVGDRRTLRAALGVGTDDLLVAMVSTLRPEKGHVHAVDAVRRLAPTFPALRLYVAGEGPSRPALERAAADLGDRVVIAGFRPDAMTVIGAADVLLQPSLHDALPTTVMEAMAAGRAIVASAVGGIPELITDGESGVLVAPPVAGEALARALAPLLRDEARRERLGAGARARFERDLSPDTWGRRLHEVYAEVAGR
jgi:glycosyltransferase involved in cell wall biosynthesis